MKRTLYILGILLTGIVGSLITWSIGCCGCCTSNSSKKEATQQVTTQSTSYPFAVIDKENGLNFSSQDNFNFYEHSDDIILPIALTTNNGVAELKNYLSTNGENTRHLDIVGLYTTKEINNSPFPNLGLARANAVKVYFEQQGIDTKYINLKSELKNDMIPNQSIYSGPVLFHPHTVSLDELAASELEFLKIHDHIQKDPLLLHFDFGAKKLTFTDKERSKMHEIVTYMDHKHNAVLDVIGHSDNIGDANKNTELGLERANFVKNYLVSIGIHAEQIKTASEGPNKPIESNDTEEGRATNRRVEIILE